MRKCINVLLSVTVALIEKVQLHFSVNPLSNIIVFNVDYYLQAARASGGRQQMSPELTRRLLHARRFIRRHQKKESKRNRKLRKVTPCYWSLVSCFGK